MKRMLRKKNPTTEPIGLLQYIRENRTAMTLSAPRTSPPTLEEWEELLDKMDKMYQKRPQRMQIWVNMSTVELWGAWWKSKNNNLTICGGIEVIDYINKWHKDHPNPTKEQINA